MEHVLHIIGFLVFWFAVDFGRDKKVKFLSKDFMVILICLILMAILLQY